MNNDQKKIAVVLLNFGGPPSIDKVWKFLFVFFRDRNIIPLRNPWRFFIALFISLKRASEAKKIYRLMGGKSPILKHTQQQAEALQVELNSQSEIEYRVFVNMRYSFPMSDTVVHEVLDFNPKEIILLPLYPQYSTTTTLSSIEHWYKYWNKIQHDAKIRTVCCYYDQSNFLSTCRNIIESDLRKSYGKTKILFSAHGLPVSVIKKGDPYQWQIETCVQHIMKSLTTQYVICYQSKATPVEWLTPSTEDSIIQAYKDGFETIIVVPIAFVSEHAETLVELDIEYKELADKIGIKHYIRSPALNTNPEFIKCLAQMCTLHKCTRSCPKHIKLCWHNN